jgi:hypothetical protein
MLYVAMLQEPPGLRLISFHADSEKDAFSRLINEYPVFAIKTLEAIPPGGEFRFRRHHNDGLGTVSHPLDTPWPGQNSVLYSTVVQSNSESSE